MVLATKAGALLLLPLRTQWARVAAVTVPVHRLRLRLTPLHMALALQTGTMVVMTAVCSVSFFRACFDVVNLTCNRMCGAIRQPHGRHVYASFVYFRLWQ